jgi:glycosyltransferase involved in cell wall biosynthesis
MTVMSNKNLVSVIMSVYNDELRVGKAIESILNQSYKNIELLIVDDSSTDKTLEICKDYIQTNVHVYKNKKNIGLTKSLNKLLKLSNGNYIARQDSDDISHPTRIEKQINHMLKNKLLVSTTRANLLENSPSKIRPRWSHHIPNTLIIKFKNPFIHGTLVIEKELLEEIGGYDEEYYFAQDFKLFSDLINLKINIQTLREPLYFLNTTDNLSTRFTSAQSEYSKKILKENRKLIIY